MIAFIQKLIIRLKNAKCLDDYGKILDDLRNTVYYDLFSTRKVIKAKNLANAMKGLTFGYIILLMWIYQNFSLQAYVYLCLHGTYGFLWVLKSLIFPDPQFEQLMTLPSAFGGIFILSLYWIIPFNMISLSQNNQHGYNLNRLAACALMYIFGLSLMMVSDCHKYYELKYRINKSGSSGLSIKNGLFYSCRNPNYLGEILIYLSFGILSNSYLSYGILLFVWSTVFLVNIICKEFSFMRKPDWEQYKQQSWILFPKLLPSNSAKSFKIYLILITLIISFQDYFKAF